MRALFFFLIIGCVSQFAVAATVPVVVAKAEQRQYSPSITVTGRLVNKTQQNLSFNVAGLITHIDVEEGQAISAGQKLASLDKRQLSARLTQAKAQVKNADDNLQRAKKLFAQKLISPQMLDDAQTRLDVAKADVSIIAYNIEHSDILAPADGHIIKRYVDEDERVNAYQPIVTVSHQDAGWILRAFVTDIDIVQLRTSQSAAVIIDAYPHHTFSGTVSETAIAADNQTGLFEIEVTVPATGKPFYSGLVATADIAVGQAMNALVIPVTAIVTAQGNKVLLYGVSEQNTAFPIYAELNHIEGNQAWIKSGLQPQQPIIIEGTTRVRDGVTVKILE